MAVREFNGSTDKLDLAAGGLSGTTFGTFAALFKVDDTANFRTLFCLESSAHAFLAAPMQVNNVDNMTWDSDTGFAIPMGVWIMMVVRKSTGSVTPRYSYYRYDTQAWVHNPSGPGFHVDFTAPGSTGFIVNYTGTGSEFFDGRIAVLAAWSNVVKWSMDASGDSAIEAAGLHTDLQNWVDQTPSMLCPYNQAAVTEAVRDFATNTANEASRTGTTVVTGDDPPGFDFALAPRIYVSTSGLQLR